MTATDTWVSSHAAQQALVILHYAYPLSLLGYFMASFMIFSIYTSEDRNASTPIQTGPGGKPLPRNKEPKKSKLASKDIFSPGARHFFTWTTVGVILTFLANAVQICLHALIEREQHWWCGEHVAVSGFKCH
jgi:ATP-binding cassette, subfamily B, vacuolar membrane transporter HMT1/ACLQ